MPPSPDTSRRAIASPDGAGHAESSSARLVEQLFEKYRDDPVSFAEDLFDEPPRDFQPELLRLVAANRSVACKATRGSGKTRAAALASLWFLFTRFDSLVFVVSPIYSQTEHFWRQLQRLWQSSKLPALFPQWEMLSDQLRGPFATWRLVSASAESGAGRLEGAHGPGGVLLVLDEAKAIPDETLPSLLGMAPAKILAVSTAGLPAGFFFRAFTSERDKWDAVLSITAADVPRLHEAAERMRDQLGEFDPVYRSQWLSEFTGSNESPFFDFAKLEASIERPIEARSDWRRVLGIDIARLGKDRSAVCVRHGDRIERFLELPRADLMETCGRIVELICANPHPEIVVVDAVGVGAGLCDRLGEVLRFRSVDRFVKLVGFNAGESPEGDEERARFVNKKTEAATRLFRRMEEGAFSIVNHPRALAELASYQRRMSSSGKQKIEDPPGKSPDFGDAAILAFAADRPRVSIVSLSNDPAVKRLLGY